MKKLEKTDQTTLPSVDRIDIFARKLRSSCPILWRQPEGLKYPVKPYIGKGWEKLVFELSVAIEQEINSCREMFPVEQLPFVDDIKEKFGSLRFSVGPIVEPIQASIDALISKAEQDSRFTCDVCGQSGAIRHHWPDLPEISFSWYRPLCQNHWYSEAERRCGQYMENTAIQLWYQGRMKNK